MVTLKAATRDAELTGERVQLVVGRVADQVSPEIAAERPDCSVYQDGHTRTLARSDAGQHLVHSEGIDGHIGQSTDTAASDAPGCEREPVGLPVRLGVDPHGKLHQ